MAGAAATATSKLSSAEPTVHTVKPNIPQEVNLQRVELDKLIETAIRLKRVNLQHLDSLGKMQYAEGMRKPLLLLAWFVIRGLVLTHDLQSSWLPQEPR